MIYLQGKTKQCNCSSSLIFQNLANSVLQYYELLFKAYDQKNAILHVLKKNKSSNQVNDVQVTMQYFINLVRSKPTAIFSCFLHFQCYGIINFIYRIVGVLFHFYCLEYGTVHRIKTLKKLSSQNEFCSCIFVKIITCLTILISPRNESHW